MADDQPELPTLPLDSKRTVIEPEVMTRAYFLRKANEGGLFSGKLLKEVDPERYEFIVKSLAESVISRREIAKICHVSGHTVQAIAEDQEENIAALRKGIAASARHLVRLSLDRLREMLLDPHSTMDAKELIAAIDKLTTTAELLDGNPTARIATDTATGGGHDTYVSDLATLRDQWAQLQDKIRARQMDAGAEKKRALGDGQSGSGADQAALQSPGGIINVPAEAVHVGPSIPPPAAVKEPNSDLKSVGQESQPTGGQGDANADRRSDA